MTKQTFAERCQIAQQLLPDAQYRAMLTKLHAEMLAALAEQPAPVQQEPVAWMQDSIELYVQDRPSAYYTIPLYTTPQAQPAREWVRLTEEEKTELRRETYALPLLLMEAVEARLREKNGGAA